MFKNLIHKIFLSFAGVLAFANLFAQQQDATPVQEPNSVFSNGVFEVMLCTIILLLFVIIGMVEVVKAGGMQQRLKAREEKAKGTTTGKIVSTLIFLMLGGALRAQDQLVPAVKNAPEFNYWNMGATTFYIMLMVIVFEVLIIYVLFRTGMTLLKVDEMKAKLAGEKEAEGSLDSKLMKSLTDAVPVEQEAAIMMDHDYDGIRELDNNLPPWWKYGFYLTIIVAVVYLLNFHVLHTGKLSIEEYNQEIKEGNERVAAFKAANRNLVDENNVTQLSDASSINEGNKLFKENCRACHGEFAQGLPDLGPNLTDDYWIHGGSVKSVFASVKYGWPDKNMKPWQQDLKPVEIQEVVSYIKTLRGSNPANAREKQGELYTEEGAEIITNNQKSDSVKSASALDSVKK